VVDDGWGMTPEEAPLSLERHATGKIRAEADLLNITTLGFRGEALPSIAQVSRFELITRTADQTAGLRLAVRGGEIIESSPWAAPVGTQVTVAELFFNTPARRKFLKSKDTEQAHIVETVRHLALAHPEVQFGLSTPAKELIAAPAPQTLLERVASLYGTELAANLLPFQSDGGPWAAAGLLSQPDFTLATSRFQVFLVNRRVVQDRILGAVLKAVYQGRLPKGRHPAAFAALVLPPDQVDVNVHPAKAEVRFADAGRVYAFLIAALRQGLGPLAGEMPVYAVRWEPVPPPAAQEAGPTLISPVPAPSVSQPIPPTAAPPISGAPPAPRRSFRFQDLLIIGQLQKTYILAQSAEGLVVIDQHAAHERVLYERLLERYTEGKIDSQPLLLAMTVEVGGEGADAIESAGAELTKLGWDVERFGDEEVVVRALPAICGARDVGSLVERLASELARTDANTAGLALAREVLATVACHAATRVGQLLDEREARALLDEIAGVDFAAACPHGRPVARTLERTRIERMFGR
jgi:DNA mismatch repair protein MutL